MRRFRPLYLLSPYVVEGPARPLAVGRDEVGTVTLSARLM